jgi:hypothetical protein
MVTVTVTVTVRLFDLLASDDHLLCFMNYSLTHQLLESEKHFNNNAMGRTLKVKDQSESSLPGSCLSRSALGY